MGSSTELEYWLLLAHDVGFVSEADYRPLANDVVELQRMHSRFIVSLRELDRFRQRRRPR